MAFFASRKPAEPAPDSITGAPADEKPQLVTPNSMAAKAMGALGINTEMLEKMSADISALLTDYRERLQRIETKLDLVAADQAELIEIWRQRMGKP